VWTIFVLTFLVASLPTNLVYILIFFTVDIGFLTIGASYFAAADGNNTAAIGLKKTGGVFCFIAGLIGWYVLPSWMSRPTSWKCPFRPLTGMVNYRYLTLHLLLKDSIVDLPLGDTSRYFARKKTE